MKLKVLRLEGCKLTTSGIMDCSVEEKLRFGKKSLIEKFFNKNFDIKELNLANNDINEVGITEIFNQLNPINSACSLKYF